MTVVMKANLVLNIAIIRKTNLVLSIAMVKNTNLDILIGKTLSPLSLFLLMVLWVLRCRNAYEYH